VETTAENTEAERVIALRKLLARARSLEIARDRTPDVSGPIELEANPPDEMDFASELGQKETEAQLKERRWARVSAIDAAFERLSSSEYGLCKECGDEISLARLRAVPFASSCLDCQRERERRPVPEAFNLGSLFLAPKIDLGESNLIENHATDSAPARRRPSLKVRREGRVNRARTPRNR
jgi:RNA polymerase-binding protein DksA